MCKVMKFQYNTHLITRAVSKSTSLSSNWTCYPMYAMNTLNFAELHRLTPSMIRKIQSTHQHYSLCFLHTISVHREYAKLSSPLRASPRPRPVTREAYLYFMTTCWPLTRPGRWHGWAWATRNTRYWYSGRTRSG